MKTNISDPPNFQEDWKYLFLILPISEMDCRILMTRKREGFFFRRTEMTCNCSDGCVATRQFFRHTRGEFSLMCKMYNYCYDSGAQMAHSVVNNSDSLHSEVLPWVDIYHSTGGEFSPSVPLQFMCWFPYQSQERKSYDRNKLERLWEIAVSLIC